MDSSGRGKLGVDSNVDDRISDLPDSILSHILSLLPTKNAVATHILSQRWKFLWTTTINLDFCYPGAVAPTGILLKFLRTTAINLACSGRRKNYTGRAVEQFVQFVNYVLLLHKPGYLHWFCLTWKTGCIPFYVNTWICTAVGRDVRELFVFVEISKLPIQVQSYLFSSERLQSLELECNICISSEIVFSLPRLERLELISVYFLSEKPLCKLLEGCPMLKYLVIHMDVGKMIENGIYSFTFIISSTSLIHLDLDAYDKLRLFESYTALCGVQLDAPSLEHIMLYHQINSIVVIQETLNSLRETNINITHFEYDDVDNEVPIYCDSFVEAFRAFGCAKTLNLSDDVIRALSCATIKMQTRFNGLTRLEVAIDWECWSSLQDIIELSDNLEVLIIVNKYEYYDRNGVHLNNSNWMKPNIVPRCLSNSLRTFSIVAYQGYPVDEVAMVDYIIKHGSVLEIMQICFGKSISDFKRKYELVQEISAIPRKSPTCEVKFCDYGSEHDAL